MDQNIKKTLKTKSHWYRVAYLIGFIFAVVFLYPIVLGLAGVLTLAQFLFVLFTSKTNKALSGIGEKMGECIGGFIVQVVKFITYASDNKPFPFSPLVAPKVNVVVAQKTPAPTKIVKTPAKKTVKKTVKK